MMKLRLSGANDRALRVLCLGSHSDDIEIGCGGTILRLLNEYPGCVFHWVVFSAIGVRKDEAQCAAESFVGSKRLERIVLKEFRDGFMPFAGSEVKDVFEDLKRSVAPDLIFTHRRNDAHQDHRLISELTWNTFRDHLILEYEVPKWDGDLGRPNIYVAAKESAMNRKISLLLQYFGTQRQKDWFQAETFLSLARLRGNECRAPEHFAEAFHVRKLALV